MDGRSGGNAILFVDSFPWCAGRTFTPFSIARPDLIGTSGPRQQLNDYCNRPDMDGRSEDTLDECLTALRMPRARQRTASHSVEEVAPIREIIVDRHREATVQGSDVHRVQDRSRAGWR